MPMSNLFRCLPSRPEVRPGTEESVIIHEDWEAVGGGTHGRGQWGHEGKEKINFESEHG